MLLQKLHSIIQRFEENCKQFLIDPLFPNIGIKQKLEIYRELSQELTNEESAYNFINVDEEIKYYKFDKPEFIKYGIFYERIEGIETNRPFGERKYYKKMLKDMTNEFESSKTNIIYFRSGGIEKDQELFSRESTQNHIFGLIKALYLVEKYLNDKVGKSSENETIENKSPLIWTGTQNQYSEMLNGFDELRVINNGELTLTELNTHFGKMLNINVRDIHSGTNEV